MLQNRFCSIGGGGQGVDGGGFLPYMGINNKN